MRTLQIRARINNLIERYSIKAAPALSHKGILKKLEETEDSSPNELKKLQHLKLRIEVICEAEDLKKISDLLKDLSGHGR
jgi:hypothetical protein